SQTMQQARAELTAQRWGGSTPPAGDGSSGTDNATFTPSGDSAGTDRFVLPNTASIDTFA
ncbi:MAG: hypothetical protein AAGL98_08480, partial [Planctomycetota bacterium]